MSQTQILRRKSSEAMETLIAHHPLQRLRSPSRTLSMTLHLLGLGSFTYSYAYLVNHPNHINQAFGWHFQYLTIIGLTLCTISFVFGLLADATLSPALFRLKNVFSIASAPMAVLISSLYWGLRMIDPALVVPPELELPLPADLSFHAVPSLALVVDLLFFSPPWTITVLPALALSTTIAFGYWFWIEACYTRNGFYPYPIFEMVDTTGRVGLFGGSAVVMCASTAVLKYVQGRFNAGLRARVGDVKKEQ